MSDREGVTECRIGMNGVMRCPSRSVLFLIAADLGSARPAALLEGQAGSRERVEVWLEGTEQKRGGEVEVERLELKHKFVWGEGEQPDHLRATLSLLCPFTWRAALNEINTFRLRVPVTSDLSETRRTVSDLCPLSLNSPCSDTSS
ncbi:putative methyl-CpG-binding domain protein 3-like 5 [Dissostichus eleginoides]|uniref:Methyl-CpG-binding domain protein 3-like 5 n=1 Tax=Dissostichus eleginoides TaxID=100907 RepID=A0AAD9FH28_DISEL|nr:putative methyl-CpG-binding domain protein 3-like 5 [Dissostichus eleginoides]